MKNNTTTDRTRSEQAKTLASRTAVDSDGGVSESSSPPTTTPAPHARGDEVDAIIARVQYDLTGDQMRAMRECDEKALRVELANLISARDEYRGERDTLATSTREWVERLTRERDEARGSAAVFGGHDGCTEDDCPTCVATRALTEDATWARNEAARDAQLAIDLGLQGSEKAARTCADRAARLERIADALATHLHNVTTIAAGDDAGAVSL